MSNVFASMAYPHWLILAGALLLVLGFVGLTLRQRSVAAASHAGANEQEPSELEGDPDPVDDYNRTAKEKRRDRWAERFEGPEEPLDAKP